MLKGQLNFLEHLGQETLGCIHFPACPLGASAALQAFTLTPASYSHSTSFMNSRLILEDFFKVQCGHIKALK